MLLLDELVAAEQNPKAHDEASLDASLTRFGYVEPIVRDDRTGRLVSGHGRTERIRARHAAGDDPPEGVEADEGQWRVPVVTGWASKDDVEANAAIIALNRIGERGGWHEEDLAGMLTNLGTAGAGLEGTGYEPDDVTELLDWLANRDGGTFDDGANAGAADTFDEQAVGYRDKQIRAMVLDYPVEEYAQLAAVAARARRALGINSTPDLFLHLLRARSLG